MSGGCSSFTLSGCWKNSAGKKPKVLLLENVQYFRNHDRRTYLPTGAERDPESRVLVHRQGLPGSQHRDAYHHPAKPQPDASWQRSAAIISPATPSSFRHPWKRDRYKRSESFLISGTKLLPSIYFQAGVTIPPRSSAEAMERGRGIRVLSD